ncbi:hypothetical protein ACOSP7_003250 [Xanthoceras sorbifolium]
MLLDVCRMSSRPKEAMELLREMETNGCLPSILTYNSLISTYARDGLLEKTMELNTHMVKIGIRPNSLLTPPSDLGLRKLGRMSLQ